MTFNNEEELKENLKLHIRYTKDNVEFHQDRKRVLKKQLEQCQLDGKFVQEKIDELKCYCEVCAFEGSCDGKDRLLKEKELKTSLGLNTQEDLKK